MKTKTGCIGIIVFAEFCCVLFHCFIIHPRIAFDDLAIIDILDDQIIYIYLSYTYFFLNCTIKHNALSYLES